jgi:hypothetical protein
VANRLELLILFPPGRGARRQTKCGGGAGQREGAVGLPLLGREPGQAFECGRHAALVPQLPECDEPFRELLSSSIVVAFLTRQMAEIARRPRHAPAVADGAEHASASLVVAARGVDLAPFQRDVAEMIAAPGNIGCIVQAGKHHRGLFDALPGVIVPPDQPQNASEIGQGGGNCRAVVQLPARRQRLLGPIEGRDMVAAPPLQRCQ